MVFPVVMYGCESWTVKKAECWRIDAFELWCWRRLLRVPWTERRSNQSILKEISPEYSLEGLMLNLKLQYFGQPDMKYWLIGKDPDTEEDWRQEEKGMKEDEILDGITDSVDMSLSKIQELWWTGKSDMLQSLGLQKVRHDWTTKLNYKIFYASHIVTTREKPLVII